MFLTDLFVFGCRRRQLPSPPHKRLTSWHRSTWTGFTGTDRLHCPQLQETNWVIVRWVFHTTGFRYSFLCPNLLWSICLIALNIHSHLRLLALSDRITFRINLKDLPRILFYPFFFHFLCWCNKIAFRSQKRFGRQQWATKWSWPPVGGFEPATFTFERRDLIRLTTARRR